jgi:hypothetical protein
VAEALSVNFMAVALGVFMVAASHAAPVEAVVKNQNKSEIERGYLVPLSIPFSLLLSSLRKRELRFCLIGYYLKCCCVEPIKEFTK